MIQMQLILVTETSKEANSDYMYIYSFVNHFFELGSDIKITPVYMTGKGNFDSQTVLKKIKTEVRTYQKLFPEGLSKVIYCFDTDEIEKKPDDAIFDKKITEFCKKRDFDLVFFCKEVEQVFLGRRAEQKEKKKLAESFYRKRQIKLIKIDKFKSAIKKPGRSNLYSILSKYLKIKDDIH